MPQKTFIPIMEKWQETEAVKLSLFYPFINLFYTLRTCSQYFFSGASVGTYPFLLPLCSTFFFFLPFGDRFMCEWTKVCQVLSK